MLVLRFVSQPFAVLLSQSPSGAVQPESTHMPALHAAPPPMNVHALPHELQLFTLFWRLVSQPSADTELQSP